MNACYENFKTSVLNMSFSSFFSSIRIHMYQYLVLFHKSMCMIRRNYSSSPPLRDCCFKFVKSVSKGAQQKLHPFITKEGWFHLTVLQGPGSQSR